jgi:membrane protease YdiL (CAAX protease family)
MTFIDLTERTQTNLLARVLYRSSGLRTGWRALAFVAFMALFEWQGIRILEVEHKLFGAGESAGGWLFEKTILFIFVLIVVLIIGAFEHRTLADYGLPLQKIFGKDFWAGALWGFGILTANIALMILTGTYSFGKIVLPMSQIVKYGVLWLAADLMVALSEEFVFRGYLQFTLTRGIGFWPAAVVTSILFGLVHLDASAPWQAIANIALLALLLCLALRRTGNLWFGIGSHMAFDWGLTFLYSCNLDARGHVYSAEMHGSPWFTGGAAGPEGNIFNVFLVAVGIRLLSKVYPLVKYPTPAQVQANVSSQPGLN